MDIFGQGIATGQPLSIEIFGQGLDQIDFQGKSAAANLAREGAGLLQQAGVFCPPATR